MLTIDREVLKSTDDLTDKQPPALWRIVATADVSADGAMITYALAHVMYAHLGMGPLRAMKIAREAHRHGRATVKEGLTKEVSETLMTHVNSCHTLKTSTHLDFKLEKM